MNTKGQKKSRIQGGGWSQAKKYTQDKNTNQPQDKVKYSSHSHNTNTIQIIQEGLVLLPAALDWKTQLWLIEKSFEIGKSTNTDTEGFYEERDGVMVLNQGTRGRVIKEIGSFPEEFKTLVLNLLDKARQVDPSLPTMDPNTVLINYYNEKATFKWHKDSEDPNLVRTKQGKPIISLSVGQTAIFAYKKRYEDTDYAEIKLHSGDVLIFGGPSRMIVHSVQEIVGRSMPPPIISKMRSGRLNLTIRDIGTGRIDKSQFPAYRVIYDDAEGIGEGDIVEKD